jgi:quercetin dioxygenase-like cupin family protein
MVFSKDLSHFFESEPGAIFCVHPKRDRVRLPQTGVAAPAYYFESLGYLVADRQMDPYFAEFVPLAADAAPKPHVHAGSEFLYVLEGEMEIAHSGQTRTLGKGDAVYFDASTPHSYRCVGAAPAEAIIVTMQSAPAQHGQGRAAASAAQARPGQAAAEKE